MSGLGAFGVADMKEGKEELPYAAFKGFGYNSMYMGVPLGPLLILFGAAVVGSFILAFLVGFFALLWPIICGLILMFLKVLCETDNKAMEVARLKFKAWMLRLRKGSRVLTVSPNQPGSKHDHFFTSLKKIHRTR